MFINRVFNGKYEYAARLLGSLAWVFLSTVMVRLAWKISRGGNGHVGMVITLDVTSFVGTLSEIIVTLMYLGILRAINSITVSCNMNYWLTSDVYENLQHNIVDTMVGASATNPVNHLSMTTAPRSIPASVSVVSPVTKNFTISTPGLTNATMGGARLLQEEDMDSAMDGTLIDSIGWKTLEIIRVSLYGLISWMDALEFIFLATIFILVFFGARRTEAIPKRFAISGLVRAGLALLESISYTMTSEFSFTYMQIAILLKICHRTLLLPIWLVWLGRLKLVQETTAEGVVSCVSDLRLDESNISDRQVL